jgi:hypothetical protein
MLEQFVELDHGRMALILGLIAIIGGLVTVVVSIVAVQWRKTYEAEVNAQLKIQMLEMGLKPDEVALVLEAGKRGRRQEVREIVRDLRHRMEERAGLHCR